ncbi:hypothetical protein, partial [Aeromicrobium panaciterrae]|uniref:hypothetical protein n=1 Tax=Aeromicrobium panaciterrae TaxID=363861 RepID=UPI0031D907E0
APGLFVLALIALLVVPVGSAARLTQHQTSAGPTQSKVAVPATRSHQAASHIDVSDRFQLDPATLTDQVDVPHIGAASTIASPAQPFGDAHRGDALARGPPAL